MVRLGLMNLMMHGIDEPNIDYKDTLSKNYNEDNQYDIVMANPPFTGSIDKGDKNPSLQVDTNKTELLFISRIFNMMKMGGTAAVVVPQGVLFGSSKAFVAARKILIEQSELKAVITMPGGVFKPYAEVATAILIFTKAGETKDVWFYEMQNDGYSLDDKRSKNDKGDLQDIIKQYQNRLNHDFHDSRINVIKDKEETDDGNHTNQSNHNTDRGGKFFFVSKKEIVENDYDLSLSKYKEEIYEEVKYEEPKVILGKLEEIESNILKELAELKGMAK
jgi:type I restriction enzyme M protein